MKNIIFYLLITGTVGLLLSQNLLKEMEVTIKVMDKGVSAQPNTTKLIVKSPLQT